MGDPGIARTYGQAILDAVWAQPDDDQLLHLAIQRASAAGARSVSVRDGDLAEADLSDALGGTLVLVRTLLTMVQEASGKDHQEIVEEARRRFVTSCSPEAKSSRQ